MGSGLRLDDEESDGASGAVGCGRVVCGRERSTKLQRVGPKNVRLLAEGALVKLNPAARRGM